jgi:hypothetical protein
MARVTHHLLDNLVLEQASMFRLKGDYSCRVEVSGKTRIDSLSKSNTNLG